MKIKKSIDLERDGIDITAMYERELRKTFSLTTLAYHNNLEAFKEMLQTIADNAFKLGQQNSEND